MAVKTIGAAQKSSGSSKRCATHCSMRLFALIYGTQRRARGKVGELGVDEMYGPVMRSSRMIRSVARKAGC